MANLVDAARDVFAYVQSAHVRRHGPQGYRDYASFKPWLRDEFTFRCVYCLTRETWKPNGHDGFSVDHIAPRSTHPEHAGVYDNLLYACVSCNARRQHVLLPINPADEPIGAHLQISDDGHAEALTTDGRKLIDLCRLNRDSLVRFRQRLLHLIGFLTQADHPDAVEALHHLLAYPNDLPNLGALRPPDGNARPGGIEQSYFAQRQRGELAETY